MLWGGGWTVDDTLDLTWQQLALVVRCVLSYKAEQASFVMEAVTKALGGKVKHPARAVKRRPRADAATRERRLVEKFTAVGLPISNV